MACSRHFLIAVLTVIAHVFAFLSAPLLSPAVKSTLSVVNVAALPDKGERLRTQVRQLEEALASLSLGQASHPGYSPDKMSRLHSD